MTRNYEQIQGSSNNLQMLSLPISLHGFSLTQEEPGKQTMEDFSKPVSLELQRSTVLLQEIIPFK